MKCVICKTGEVRPTTTQAELEVSADRLLVSVEAEVCGQCGETYYSADTMRALERVRDDFARNGIRAAAVGKVYQIA